MTTPIDSTSPFAGSTPASTDFKEASLGMDDFSIHTMQDDLLELQKNPALIKTTTDKEVPRKIMPTPPVSISEPQQIITETKNMMASTPTPTPQKAMNEPKNMPTEGISPFVKQTAIPSKKELVEMPFPEKETASKNTLFIVMIVIIVSIVIAVLLGGYYFFKNSSKQTPASETIAVQPVENQQPKEVPPVINVVTEKYSSEKPNYLSLDIATLSSEDIQKEITDVAEELKSTAKKQLPYEFVVVDTNNNPVAFPIFAIAAKLNLSSAILKNLGENFSLFFYNDNDNERLSAVIDIKDKQILATELSKQEKTFIADASFLFLNETPEITKGSFQESTYANIPVRFFNVNSQITMSIDYAIVNDKLIIATSKNTVRAIIDNLMAQKVVN